MFIGIFLIGKNFNILKKGKNIEGVAKDFSVFYTQYLKEQNAIPDFYNELNCEEHLTEFMKAWLEGINEINFWLKKISLTPKIA